MTIRQLTRAQGLVIKANKKEINPRFEFKKLRFEVKNVVYNLGSDKKVTNKKGIATRARNRLSALKGLLPTSFVRSKFKLESRTRSEYGLYFRIFYREFLISAAPLRSYF